MATTTEIGQVVRDNAFNGMNEKSPEKSDKSPARHDTPHKPTLFQPHDSSRLHDSSEQNNSHKSPTKDESSLGVVAKNEHSHEPGGAVVERADFNMAAHTLTQKHEKTDAASGYVVPHGHVVETTVTHAPEPVLHHKAEPIHPKEGVEAAESVESAEEEKSDEPEAEEKAESDENMDVDEKVIQPDEESTDGTHTAPSADVIEKSPTRAKSPPKISATPKKSSDETSAVSPKKTPVSSRKRKFVTEPRGPDDKTPLLEAPLVVDGKRARQRTERLDLTSSTPERKEVEIPHGKGQKLGDIKFVEAMISKTLGSSLKTLHRVACGRGGPASQLKKNLRQFNGFGFTVDSVEYQKKKKQIEALPVSEVREMCDVFGLDRVPKKEEMCEAVLAYMMKPVDKGKELPKTPAKRSPAKKKATSTKKTPGRRGRKSAASKGATSDEEEPEEEEEEEAAPAAEETHEPPVKKTKRGRPAATPTATASKKPAASTSSRSAKKSAFPSDSDIKGTIKELLKGVNLEEVTMKEMMTKVYEKYPGQDLTSKKDFIKESVKLLLSNN